MLMSTAVDSIHEAKILARRLSDPIVRDLLHASIQVEELMRDDLNLVSHNFCEICNSAAKTGDEGDAWADIEHAPDCVYARLRDAITAATQRT